MDVIDKNSRMPAYVQLMDRIISQIDLGVLEEDQKIPPERELCEIYGVSRSTVRQAIQELEKDRYVYVQHGIGTFVSPKQYKQKLLSFYSFTEEMKKQGKIPSTKVISFEKVSCDERIARKMQLNVGDMIYHFTRLRYADDEAIMIVTSYIPCERFPDFSGESLQNNASLYQIFMDVYGVIFSKAQESLQAVGARNHEAKLLHIPPGSPCMLVERLTYEKEKVIEYAAGITRGDQLQYDIELFK